MTRGKDYVDMVGFASDYDGTLDLHRGEGISAADRSAIRQFREHGGLFGMCTGRCREGLRHKVEGIIELDFAILMTGAVVLDGKGGILFERRIAHDTMKELVSRYKWMTFGLYLVAGDEYWRKSTFSPVQKVNGVFNLVRSLDAIPDPLYGLAFRMPTERAAGRIAQSINREYGEVVTAHQNKNSIDVTPAGCSKASGLQVVREQLGIDVMGAMGDSFNDMPMLEAADVGYTFPNVPVRVRNASDVLAKSVGSALEDFVSRTRCDEAE